MVVHGTTAIQPTDDDLFRYAYAMAYWAIDPRKRHLRPMPFLRWQQLGTGLDETRPHGTEVDDKQMAMEPLPLPGGWTEAPQPSTIKTRPGRKGSSAAKRPRSSARAPIIRNLTTGELGDPDGG